MDAFLAALERTQIIALLGVLILLFLWESFHPFYEYFANSRKDQTVGGMLKTPLKKND